MTTPDQAGLVFPYYMPDAVEQHYANNVQVERAVNQLPFFPHNNVYVPDYFSGHSFNSNTFTDIPDAVVEWRKHEEWTCFVVELFMSFRAPPSSAWIHWRALTDDYSGNSWVSQLGRRVVNNALNYEHYSCASDITRYVPARRLRTKIQWRFDPSIPVPSGGVSLDGSCFLSANVKEIIPPFAYRI